MKIIVESNVPYLEVLDRVADVERLPYGEITREAVRDADALIVRTRNRCDRSLLEGSKVRFIATATIGTDHIDLDWCRANGIEVYNAPGSNAPAVAQYVFSSLMRVVSRPLKSYTLGIVGVGHVGGIVDRWARSMGMTTLLCDPFLNYEATLADLAHTADIITFHTPLTDDGPYPTYHLAGENFFNNLRRAPIIINSARGAVVDNAVWADALEVGVCGPAIVDCWENEPDINFRLLDKAVIATPHIAGYSIEGKKRASQMALDALCRHFGVGPLTIDAELPQECAATITPVVALKGYNPLDDTAALKAHPEDFEKLRNNYILRHELSEALEN